MYVGEIKTGVTIKTDSKPEILKQTCATALVDGRSLLGKKQKMKLNVFSEHCLLICASQSMFAFEKILFSIFFSQE